MASGVSADGSCLTAYEELKLGKKIKYIVFGLSNDNTKIVVTDKAEGDPTKSSEENYNEFASKLLPKTCCYAVYDFDFEKEGDGKRNKICFFTWSPDDSNIRHKMVYASSKDALRRSLQGIQVEVQGTDPSEISYEAVLQKCNKGF